MTNHALVLKAFDHLACTVNHVNTLIPAVQRLGPTAEHLARQLVEQAINDGVLTMDSLGEVRKA